MTKAQEFVRCLYGTPTTVVQVVIAFLCQACGHLPKVDHDYFVLHMCGMLSGWY